MKCMYQQRYTLVVLASTKSSATTEKADELRTSIAISIKDKATAKTLCSTTPCVHTKSHEHISNHVRNQYL